MPRKSPLKLSDVRILFAIHELNEMNYYPLPHGVYKILAGVDDDETLPFRELQAYQTQISRSFKNVSRDISQLTKKGLISKIYVEQFDDYYLKLTDIGKSALRYYSSKKKYKINKCQKELHPTIISLD